MSTGGGNTKQVAMGKLGVASGLLVAVLVLCFAVAALIGANRYGGNGVLAAALAVGWCGVSALVALWVTGLLTGTPQALAGSLGGMLLRTGGPLAGLLLLPSEFPQLKEAGLVGMLLGVYLTVLAAETLLAVWLVSGTGTMAAGNGGRKNSSAGKSKAQPREHAAQDDRA